MKREREKPAVSAGQAREPYAAPNLTVHGTVEQLTQSNTTMGSSLDADFKAGTKWRDLTWS